MKGIKATAINSDRENAFSLVVFDMEGCLAQAPTVWEIMHVKNGTWDSHGEPYWSRYLSGELHYDEFARMDVAAWSGAPAGMLKEAAEEVRFMPGSRRLLARLKAAGVCTVLISNGLMCVARRFVSECGVDKVFANRAVIDSGRVTGELEISVPYDSKGLILKKIMNEMDVDSNAVVAVGDSVSDMAMFDLSGLSLAICPENRRVRCAATHVIEEQNLRRCEDIMLGVNIRK